MAVTAPTAWTSATDGHVARPQDRDGLVTANLGLVDRIVAEVIARFPRHVERQELWNAGALGLVEAAERFDADRGVPFPRFAAVRVRGAIMDATRSRDWASRSLRRTARCVEAARQAVQQRTGRTPSDEELGAELGMAPDELRAHRAATQQAELINLEQPAGGDDEEPWTVGELVAEVTQERLPEDALLHRELVGTLRAAVAGLAPRLREVVERYYEHGECLADIAESLGLTEARASQLRGEAVAALSAYLAEQFDGCDRAEASPGVRRRAAFLEVMATTSWHDRLAAADGAGITGGDRPANLAAWCDCGPRA
jgi:RNA polymerase sigma factor for flagellar operon FliA